MTPTIYLAYHKPSTLIASDNLRPIHVGRAGAAQPLLNMIGDDTGENISQSNGKYCELTALYWAWKNDQDSSHIGLMHYRRLLDFSGEHLSEQTENFVPELDVDSYTESTQNWLKEESDNYDIVLPAYHTMGLSIRDNFSKGHKPQDLDIAVNKIKELYPDYTECLEETLEDKKILLANMSLMRRDIFDKYCEWVFDIIQHVDSADIDRKHYNMYQSRVLGFISERLFTVFIRKYLKDNPETRIKYVNIINLSKATLYPLISDDSLNGRENVNIAMTSDEAYLPHAAAMIHSLAVHSNPDRKYNLFYLYSGISSANLELLGSVTAPYPNIVLNCIDVGNVFEKAYRSKTRAPSNATYNRFLLFRMFPTLDRMLYIDTDMILLGDVAEIYDWEMGDAQIAAVPDFIMTRSLTTEVVTRDGNMKDLYSYHRETLGLSDEQINSYFNAGLLLFNFTAIDMKKVGEELMQLAYSTEFLFRDQDILNSYFKNSYLRLPGKYNVFNSRSNHYTNVPLENWKEALGAKKKPFIVHFASGEFKPWKNIRVEFAQLYWRHLRETPFYGHIIENVIDTRIRQKLNHGGSAASIYRRAYKWLARGTPIPVKRTLRRLRVA